MNRVVSTYHLFKLRFHELFCEDFCDIFKGIELHPRSVTKETMALGNLERKVMVYDTKGFFDTADWSFGDWPKTKDGIKTKLAKEIRDLWITVAHSGGIDAVALVVTQNRGPIQYTSESPRKSS